MDLIKSAQEKLSELIAEQGWLKEPIRVVTARSLTAEEAIGRPERNDYPIQKGKEVMLEAEFRGAKGQAFTDQPGTFEGDIEEVISLSLHNNFERAVLIATLNAVLRSQGKITATVHCRDEEPGRCAQKLTTHIRERFGNPRIAFIGLQPGMVAALSQEFEIRVVDLDPDNIGKIKAGVLIEDVSHTEEILEWGDIILATGSTSVNDSLAGLLGSKPIIFYGVTIAGLSYLHGFEQYCPCAH
jgi:hypothetical protein